MSAVTQWFPENVLPVREGFYEVEPKFHDKWSRWAYWNGHRWSYFGRSIPRVKREFLPRIDRMSHKTLEWRGLAVKP